MQQSFVCVLLYALFSCTSLFANTPNNTGLTVSGSIVYPSQNEIEIAIFTDPLMYREEHYVMFLDAAKNFYSTIPLEEAHLAELRYQDRTIPLWIEPGQHLSIKIDASDFPNSLKYTGYDNAANNFLADFYKKYGQINREVEEFMETADAASYADFITDLHKDRSRFIGKNEHFRAAPASLVEHVRHTETYWYASQLLRFAFDKPLFSGEVEPLVLDDSYYAFLKNVDLDIKDALYNTEFRCYVERYAEFLEQQNTTKKENNLKPAPLTGEALCYIQGREIATKCRSKQASTEELEAMVNCFTSSCGNTALCEAVQAIYDESRSATVGSMAPDFVLKNAKGETVSLSDYRGKIVYVEFWATWCGPCRKEMPKLQELAAQNKGKVEVLYISLDKDESTWRNYVYGSSLNTSTHFYAGDMNKALVAQQYGVRTLPTAFLIDQCGQLIFIKKKKEQSEEIQPIIDSLLDFMAISAEKI